VLFKVQRYKKISSPANFKAIIISKIERFLSNQLHLIYNICKRWGRVRDDGRDMGEMTGGIKGGMKNPRCLYTRGFRGLIGGMKPFLKNAVFFVIDSLYFASDGSLVLTN
jgi:hypothetical protein